MASERAEPATATSSPAITSSPWPIPAAFPLDRPRPTNLVTVEVASGPSDVAGGTAAVTNPFQ